MKGTLDVLISLVEAIVIVAFFPLFILGLLVGFVSRGTWEAIQTGWKA